MIAVEANIKEFVIVIIVLLIAEFAVNLLVPQASGLVHTICVIVFLWKLWNLIVRPLLGPGR